jgi:hypothetical protein
VTYLTNAMLASLSFVRETNKGPETF